MIIIEVKNIIFQSNTIDKNSQGVSKDTPYTTIGQRIHCSIGIN